MTHETQKYRLLIGAMILTSLLPLFFVTPNFATAGSTWLYASALLGYVGISGLEIFLVRFDRQYGLCVHAYLSVLFYSAQRSVAYGAAHHLSFRSGSHVVYVCDPPTAQIVCARESSYQSRLAPDRSYGWCTDWCAKGILARQQCACKKSLE